MLHQWFTCVHLLDTYLANLTEGFQLSFTTHLFPSEQHKVVCNQHLHAECSGSATISLEVRQKSIKYSQYLTSFCLRTHILVQSYGEAMKVRFTGREYFLQSNYFSQHSANFGYMTDSIALTINSVSNFLAKKQFVYMFFVPSVFLKSMNRTVS